MLEAKASEFVDNGLAKLITFVCDIFAEVFKQYNFFTAVG